MMSYEEFSRSSYLENEKVQVGAASTGTALNDVATGPAGVEGESGEQNRVNKSMNISLDLDDGSHIDLVLRPAGKGKGLLGRGDLIRDGEVETERESVNATGTQDENRLFLELVSQVEATYRFDLQASGEAVLGNYTRVMPNGETKQGTAIGVRRS
jgi:hypothetical protein